MIQLSDNLYQGSRNDTDESVWYPMGIRSVLRVSSANRKEGLFTSTKNDFSYLWCPFDDEGKDLTREKLNTIISFYQSMKGPTLIHCSAGQNRSVVISAYLLVSANNCSVPDIVKLIRSKKNDLKVYPALIEKVKQLADLDFIRLLNQ